MGKLGKIVFPLALATGLIAALFATVDIPVDAVIEALGRFDILSLVAILLCTAAFVSLSALKWQIVHNRAQTEAGAHLPWSLALYLTSMGAALSIVAIPQVAVMITRSVGARYSLGKSTRETAAMTAYEQLFDLVPLGVLAVATIVALVLDLGGPAWMVLAAMGLGITCAALVALAAPLGRNARPLTALLPASLARRFSWVASPEVAGLLHPAVTARILAISCVRYAFVFLRAWLIMRVVALPIATADFAQGFSLVRAIGLVGLTPGSLGITEWSWTGVLALFGLSAAAAATFALANRLLNSLALVSLFLIVMVDYRIRGQGWRQPHLDKSASH